MVSFIVAAGSVDKEKISGITVVGLRSVFGL
jgi:hypothetical protein